MSRTSEEYQRIYAFVRRFPGEKMGDVAMRLDAELVALRSTHAEVFAAFTQQHTELATLRESLAKAREEVERAWACRDDEMALRTMEAEQRIAAERARDEAVKAYRRAADALGWAREIGADEVAQYAALAPEETALDDTGREEFRAGVLAAANYLVGISVPGHISAQFILDLAAGIRALPTPVVEDDECGFCLRPMRERNTKCLLCSPPAPAEQEVGRCPAEGSPTEAGRCHKCGCVVEPSPCHCGKSHTGTYCWSCHHKNVSSCAAPHCPEHGAAAAQAWLDGQDPAPSPEAPARCPECECGSSLAHEKPECRVRRTK